jgi:hypothetical protein
VQVQVHPPPYYAYAAPRPAPVPILVEEPRPRRSGITLEASLGVSVTRFDPADDGYESSPESVSRNGISGLNLGIGGFVSPTTALTLRIAGTTFTETSYYGDTTFVAGFAGPAVQTWLGDRAFIGAGVGVGFLAIPDDAESEPETALGLDFRLGFDLVSGRGGALHLAVEVTPAFYEIGTVTGVGLQLGAQLF